MTKVLLTIEKIMQHISLFPQGEGLGEGGWYMALLFFNL